MKQIIITVLVILLSAPAFPAPTQTQSSGDVQIPKDFENSLSATLEITKELGLVEDPEKTERLNNIAYRVAQRSAPDIDYFSFRIVQMDEPNAFAMPGGFIFVTTGMLDLDLNDDELAALLGHEITHVRNEHSRKMAKRQTLMNLLYQALVIGVAVGIKDSGGYDPVTGAPRRSAKSEILQGSTAFGLIFQELLLRGFSREYELEADHEGMIAASRAGFSPTGTTALFEKMHSHLYEAPGYGYWRTHPYLDERSDIARAQSATLEPSKNPADATDYRVRTQQMFLNLLPKEKDDARKAELRKMALHAYPRGETAQELRSWFINNAESEENKKEPFFRDYGRLVHLYETTIAETKKDDPSESATLFVQKLEKDLAGVQKARENAKPLYEEVLAKQMFDTEMLRRYLNNFPESPSCNEIRFRLAENFRILKKNTEAVDLYLQILAADGESEWKDKTKKSLHHLVPGLDNLIACYRIGEQKNDTELSALAIDRMKQLSASFTSLQDGYEFRRKYPGNSYEEPVLSQMTKLAEDVLHQAKLYQAIGEYQKALDNYNKILRYCADLPIADQVKDSMVDFEALNSSQG